MILQNTIRNGNVTSSGIVALTKKAKNGKDFGAPAITYIEECNIERWLGDAMETETDARPLQWGNLCEPRVHDILPLDYRYCSDETMQHPTIPYWVGSPDGFKEIAERTVAEIKCPMTKKSFVKLVLPLYCGMGEDVTLSNGTIARVGGIEAMYAVRDGFNHEGTEYSEHKDGAKFYWQISSNGIISGCEYGELIVYMPRQSELLDIFNSVSEDPAFNWMKYNPDCVPCLKDDGIFRSVNIIRFRIPQSDKDFLTERVLAAGEMLITI